MDTAYRGEIGRDLIHILPVRKQRSEKDVGVFRQLSAMDVMREICNHDLPFTFAFKSRYTP